MLKVGIVGSGFGLYGQLPAFNSIKNCQVVSICGKSTPRLLNYCQSIGLKKIYSNWKLMLENEQLDAIAVAVTPDAQYKIVKAAINKGLHIFAEKPLAENFKHAKELTLLAKKKRVVTAVDFIFPEIEEWEKVKNILQSGEFGKLNHISTSWDFLSYDIKNKISSWKTDKTKGGGAVSFYFSHVLYYLEFFGGEISATKSQLTYSKESKNGGEVGVGLLMKFKTGATGNAQFSCNAKGLNTHRLVFFLEKATIVLENKGSVTKNFTITVHSADKVKTITVKKKKLSKNDEDERVQYVKKIATRFVSACVNKKEVRPSFKEGLRVQTLIEKIY
jgi:predicted dehydrogenase